MRPPCGEKCCLKCSIKLNSTTRQNFFDAFWGLGDLQRQREYIVRHTHEIKPKYRYTSTKNYRSLNTAFYFEENNSRIRVCKNFFKATLDLGDQAIKTALMKKSEARFIEGEQRGKHKNYPTVDPAVEESVVQFINSIPRVESHYLRAQTTREYIQSERSFANIYQDYKYLRQANNWPFASESTFQRIFNVQFNIGLFSPKKYLCDLCESYKNASEEKKLKLQQDYEQLLLEKDLARSEKKKDKKESDAIVVVYDLQAVMQILKEQVSLFFYKSRINCFNFTISDLHAKNVDCFFWDETKGKRGAVEIGSCDLAFIEMHLNNRPSGDIDLIFYSDNCCGQQKNKYLLSAYAYAVCNMRVKSITHKFLIRGHSQNEGDNVHSVIEKQVKRHIKSGPIYMPLQYITLILSAKKSGPAYKVHEMTHDRFYDLKALQEAWGTNFNMDEDKKQVKWHDIKMLKVEKDSPMVFFIKHLLQKPNSKNVG
ncbi:unnamed protein product [Psylliodes chrysocephalus]|uniref:DUF7869 domain-containing protein n=1 Tax=Psylliodes chrysocephalus TaxID=3402493 RepID=A0A9P0C8A9_9CUCU|nr:unnamed protein product [Psylliodes chrysocephala]